MAHICYFPDGTVAPDDVPCNSASSASACCNKIDTCLDNHLCLETHDYTIISRGTCTDSTWQSGECAQFCQDGRLSRSWLLACELRFLQLPSQLERRDTNLRHLALQILLRFGIYVKLVMPA